MHKPLELLLATVLTATLPALAIAAGDHKGHAHDSKPMHGGVVVAVKDVQYELVVKPDTIALHVSDHGKPLNLAGASAKLTLLSATEKAEVTLSPAGDRLAAPHRFKAGAGSKAIAVVALAGKAPVTVRFTLP